LSEDKIQETRRSESVSKKRIVGVGGFLGLAFLLAIAAGLIFYGPGKAVAQESVACEGTVVVNGDVWIDFNQANPANYYQGPDMVLKPYFSYDKSGGATADKWKAIFDLGDQKLVVKDGATITVVAVPNVGNNRYSPGIVIYACALDIEQDINHDGEPGRILVLSYNKTAGDILIQVKNDMNVWGTVHDEVAGTNGRPGNITLVSCSGTITIGDTGRVETVGIDEGGSDINILTCCPTDKGDIVIDGLVDASYKGVKASTINIVSFGGAVTIDGNNLIYNEGPYPVYSGVSVRSKRDPLGGKINIQAMDDIIVRGYTELNNTNPYLGAVRGNRKATSGQGNGGNLRVVSVEGKIEAYDRAFDFANRFNQLATIDLSAKGDIALSSTHYVIAVVSTQGSGGGGIGGKNRLRSYSEGIIIGVNAQMLADGTAVNGTNLLTSCAGVANSGLVKPADSVPGDDSGVCSSEAPDPLFDSCEDFAQYGVKICECGQIPTCPTCDNPIVSVVVNQNVTVDFSNPPTYSVPGYLLPYFTADVSGGATPDKWVAIFDFGTKKLVVKDNYTITVKKMPTGTPGIAIRSTCEVEVEGDLDGNGTPGQIVVESSNKDAGDILIRVDGSITINGRVRDEVIGTLGMPGNITIATKCGDITVGPKGEVLDLGIDPGGRDINIVTTCDGDIVINGLVMAFAHGHGADQSEATRPDIRVVAYNGSVTINGNSAEPFWDEYSVGGGRYDIYPGLLSWIRDNAAPGSVTVQALNDITVTGHGDDPTTPARTSFAAIAVVTTASTPQGGVVDVRSLQGKITGNNRAFQVYRATGARPTLINLGAAMDITLNRPGANNTFNPVVDVRSYGTGMASGGTNEIRSYSKGITIGTNAWVLATGSPNGANHFTSCTGVINNGTVNPPPVVATNCIPLAPVGLFTNWLVDFSLIQFICEAVI
jgi:hypothetical protein